MVYVFALAASLAAVLTPFAASGAEINRSWDTLVGAVKTGNKIVVTRKNSASLEGKLLSIDDQSITIQQRGGQQEIARADVFRVRYARAGHPVVLGTLIGAGSGAVILSAVDRGSKHPQPGEAWRMGMLLGALAGAIVGAPPRHGAPLYEAAGVVRKTP